MYYRLQEDAASVPKYVGVFRRVNKISKSEYWLPRDCLSIRPPRTRVPLDEFSWDVTFEYFSKNSREDSSFIKIWQRITGIYMNAYVHLWKYLAELFSELEIFRIKVVEKIKTYILISFFFFETRVVYGIIWKKYGTAGQATDNDITRCMRCVCWVASPQRDSAVYTYCSSAAIMFMRTRLNIRLNVHYLSFWNYVCL
jgi:hypothetical protein